MNNWRIMAEDHWRKFLPQYYADLKAGGILEEKLDRAAENMREAMLHLVDQGMRPNEASEILLPQYILLAPEPVPDDPGD